jgi:hypothetical protein
MDVVTGFTEAEIKGITLEREGDWLRVIPGSPVEERFVLNGATFLARMAGTGYVPQSKLADAGLLIEEFGTKSHSGGIARGSCSNFKN